MRWIEVERQGLDGYQLFARIELARLVVSEMDRNRNQTGRKGVIEEYGIALKECWRNDLIACT